jgi:hypothetical protein
MRLRHPLWDGIVGAKADEHQPLPAMFKRQLFDRNFLDSGPRSFAPRSSEENYDKGCSLAKYIPERFDTITPRKMFLRL